MAAAFRSLGERFLSTFGAPLFEDEVEMAIYEKEEVELECLNLGGRAAIPGPDSGYIVDFDSSGEKDVVAPGRKDRPSPAGAEGWQLEDVRVTEAKPGKVSRQSQQDRAEGDPERWTLVSRLASTAAQAVQQPAKASSSGCSTPSNLERAVLLLEAEGDRDSHGNSGNAPVPKPATSTRGGLNRAGSGETGASMADATDSAQKDADVRADAGRTAVRAVQGTSTGDNSMAAEEPADEGPSTPPTLSGMLRSSQEASSPGSTTDDGPERFPPLPQEEPGRSEMQYYATCINAWLGGDAELLHVLPLQPSRVQLVSACRDGILLCKLLNSCAPDTVDERALNRPAPGGAGGGTAPELAHGGALQNSALCINAAKALGCSLAGLSPEDMVDGEEEPVLSCVRQIIRLAALRGVSVKAVPELLVLRRPEEAISALLDAPPEALLLRWAAHHVSAAGPPWDERCLPLRDAGPDLADCTALACLLTQLDDSEPGAAVDLRGADLVARAEAVLAASRRLTAEPLPPARGIAEGRPELCCALLAALFRARHGLGGAADGAAAQLQLSQFAQWLEEYDVQDSREERTFRVWLLSLLRNEVHIGDLREALRDGYVLLRVLDRLAPGCVDWGRCHAPPFKPLHRHPRSVENCNQVVHIARRVLALPLVNIGGTDIISGHHKLLLAILWQLMRFNIRGLLQAVSSKGTRISDAELDREILSWANARVAAAGGQRRIASFHDADLASGLFLVDLLAAVDPQCIKLAMVTPGSTPTEQEMNAKYIISTTRKLGCCIFLLWEDVVEVNSKMLLVLVASLMLRAMQDPTGS